MPRLLPEKRTSVPSFVFDKFTIPADKMLVVEMHEKSGGRHQTFTGE